MTLDELAAKLGETMEANPITVAAVINRKRARERAEMSARWEQGRRRDARARGYRGPLTRDEAARMVLRAT